MDVDIKFKHIEVGHKVGEGVYAVIFGGKWKNRIVALKQLKTSQLSSHAKDSFNKEATMLHRLKHPNVVRLLGICKHHGAKDCENRMLVLEYLPCSSLFHQVHDLNIRIPVWQQIHIAIDIANALNYLHQSSPKIIHRDLKSAK